MPPSVKRQGRGGKTDVTGVAGSRHVEELPLKAAPDGALDHGTYA